MNTNNSLINRDPKVWGPSVWFTIESVVYSLPNQVPLELERDTIKFFYDLSKVLPCENCRHHYGKYLEKTKVFPGTRVKVFKTRSSALQWINELHNKVRIRTGGPDSQISTGEMVQYYNSKYGTETVTTNRDVVLVLMITLILVTIIQLSKS